MDSEDTSESSLTVTEFKGGGGEYTTFEDGATYEAEYSGLSVFMDESPWGTKKAARLYFTITRGQYKGKKASFKGFFFQDNETKVWVVGGRSKLAEAIRGVTGGTTIDKSHKGVKVFITIKNKTSKKGNVFSLIDKIIPKPKDESEAPVASNAQPAAKLNVGSGPAPAAAPKADDSDKGLLDDLTELSDFTS